MNLTIKEINKLLEMSEEEREKYYKERKKERQKERETTVDERKVFPAFNSPI